MQPPPQGHGYGTRPLAAILARPVSAIRNGIVGIGHAAAWLILPILFLVVAGVTLSALKVGTLLRWEADAFLFGSKLTLASLGDLQWHLFGVMLMLSLAGALIGDRHVRVDFIRQRLGQKTKQVIDLLGHLFLLLPFTAIVLWHGFDFAVRSFHLGEGSDYDGLYDRFVIKSFLPIGFALLVIAGLTLSLQLLLDIFKPPPKSKDESP